VKLDEARISLLDSHANWAVVQAFAGAGKTRLAIEVAKRFLKAPGLRAGQRILFISFSTASCIRAEESLRASAIRSDEFEVCTFHAFAFGLVRRYADRLGLVGPIRTGMRTASTGTHVSFDELVVHARTLLADADVAELVPDAYPLVIVDEFQHTSPSLLDLLQAGFVGKSSVRCFGDSDQRIQPESLSFDAHAASLAAGAEEHRIEPLPRFCRYKTYEIAHLAEAFRDARRFSGNSDLISFESVPSEGEKLAHTICWDALDSVKEGRTTAIICFNNPTVGNIADLLSTPPTKRRRPLRVATVLSKDLMSAQDELYLALLRHWLAPSVETETGVIKTLALLTVGGKVDHRHYRSRVKQLAKAMKANKLPGFPSRCGNATELQDVARIVEALGSVAGALGNAAIGMWSSAAWGLGGLRSLAWTLSQSIPDGLNLDDDLHSIDRLAQTWDQARRWRTSREAPVLVMTVNQSKNREFEDVVVYVDGFKNEIRGAITELNRMQMYVAVSRARRGVKVLWTENKQTKPSDLLTTVVP